MIGERVRLFRVLRKYTQTQVGLACGVKQGTISKVERGRYPPSASLLARLAQVLDCEVAVLTAPPPPDKPLYTIQVNTGPDPAPPPPPAEPLEGGAAPEAPDDPAGPDAPPPAPDAPAAP
ncbi:MAG TPA: helix-turn-helix transcriptional regulator [Flavobacteriales bacterium]|nr:helix-turn-helix transcriptional regulator [Flavobacteriales bacterium]